MSFRARWALSRLLDRSASARLGEVLDSRRQWYAALVAKAVPGVWPAPVTLTLRDGSAVRVREFMSLYIFEEIFLDGCYDEPSLEGVAAPVIVDVGANTGQFALRMARLYPDARLTCFEPYPPNRAALDETVRINGLGERVEVVGAAVAGRAGEIELHVHPRNVGGHSIDPDVADPGAATVTVRCTTLAELLDERGIERCDLLKLDCEGAEHAILAGLDAALAERVERIVFEPTPQAYDVAALTAHLADLGYSLGEHRGLSVAVRGGETGGDVRPLDIAA